VFLEPVATEYVIQISDEEKNQMLKSHFNSFFHLCCASRFEPTASSENVDGLHRHVSGIPIPFLNAVVGTVSCDAEERVRRELAHFNAIGLPFVWYVDEGADFTLNTQLTEHGFQEAGIFQGVIGPLGRAIPDFELPEGCTIEPVTTEAAMHEFSELVCGTFDIQGEGKNLFTKTLWRLATKEPPTLSHWVARENGVAVSVVSTFIEGPIVSFWNEATLPHDKSRDIATALWRFALKDAVSRKCRFGICYFMSEGLEFGICQRLGYETRWRFHAFLSP
jgi:hypothetical protein